MSKGKRSENAFERISSADAHGGLDWRRLFLVNIRAQNNGLSLGMLVDGRLCTAARILAGLSQAELAAKASLHVSVVARFEQGLSQPRLSTLRAIFDVLADHGVELTGPNDRHAGGIGLVKEKWRPGDRQRGGRA